MNSPQVWFTFGEMTREEGMVRKLLQAGATGARLTFSYGTPDLQVDRANLVRRIADELGRSVYLVADLQGEKCRINKVGDIKEVPVERGQIVHFTAGEADPSAIEPTLPVQIASHLAMFTSGDIVIEGDGALILRVEDATESRVSCVVLTTGGALHPGRGLAIQSERFRPSAFTAKDRSDLASIMDSKAFDAIALSFVGESRDIQDARDAMRGGLKLPIIAKIETPLGIANIREIAREADALMAARGDLALTMPWVELYSSVRKIAEAAKESSVPWVVATQLVEGLERFVFPTRPEICDLAHWMEEGAAGAMASFETAFGSRPEAAVSSVAAIVHRYSKK